MIRAQSIKITSSIKKIVMLSITISLISAGIFAGGNMFANAKKPDAVIGWSNGFPSGEHSNLNIHGKKIDFNCDNSGEGVEDYGSSIFVPIDSAEAGGPSEIDFVSNKRSSLDHLKVIDPCADPFGVPGNIDPALVQLPKGDHQVYWRILGKPNNGNNGPSEAMLTFPRLIDQCNFLPVAFDDGTIVQSFDPDAQAALTLVPFTADEKHTDSGDGFFQNTESIYFDTDTSGDVSAGDVLLYGPGEADGTTLIGFDPSEKHEDTGTTPNFFDPGETIYLDQGVLGTVDEGETRIANASSQGLPEDEGGDAINCEDETLVGLGFVTNNGVFKKTEEGLERFDTTSTTGKGKSKAIEITDLFLWTGVICDPILDTNMDGQLTLDDFPGLTEVDVANVGVVVNGDTILDDAEFQAYLATLAECELFAEEWVFSIADIVIYGLDYVNNGSTLTQIRFYPVETTEFS